MSVSASDITARFTAEQKQLNSHRHAEPSRISGTANNVTTVEEVIAASQDKMTAAEAGVLLGSNPTATLQKQVPELKKVDRNSN